MTKNKQELEMEESIDQSERNIGEHSLSTSPKELSVAGQFRGVDIEGLESVPMSMVAVPFCRLIQPTSKKTERSDGKEATQGSFFFNDIQEEVASLHFVLLRAKHEMKRVDLDGNYVGPDYDGPTKPKPQVSILGITTDTNKLFVLSLSSTSFSSFGKMIAKFKSLQVDKTWRFALEATSEKMENKKGKYYIVNFRIDGELDKDEITQMSKVASEYGVVLDRQITEEEE